MDNFFAMKFCVSGVTSSEYGFGNDASVKNILFTIDSHVNGDDDENNCGTFPSTSAGLEIKVFELVGSLLFLSIINKIP